LGVKAFEYRRVKNDVRDAADLADLLRMGSLPEAWIAPPATREEHFGHKRSRRVRHGFGLRLGSVMGALCQHYGDLAGARQAVPFGLAR